MSNIWASGKAREDAHFFRTMLGIPSDPVDSEELRPNKVILKISGVNLTSFISAWVSQDVMGFSLFSIVKTDEK